jgi:hypothetical protein
VQRKAVVFACILLRLGNFKYLDLLIDSLRGNQTT